MLTPQIYLKQQSPDHTQCDVVPVFQNAKGEPLYPQGGYGDLVKKLSEDQVFNGKTGSVVFLRYQGKKAAESVAFVGMGCPGHYAEWDGGLPGIEEKLRTVGGQIFHKLHVEKIQSACVHLDLFFESAQFEKSVSPPRAARLLSEGLILPAYEFKKYHTSKPGDTAAKSTKTAKKPMQISIYSKGKGTWAGIEAETARANAIGEAVAIARDWSNEPSNFGTPAYFADQCVALAKKYGLTCRILGEKEAKKENMNLFLAVGQGSERENKLVVLEYKPKNIKNPKKVGFVGKGVTFDSGGISIKPALRMEEMKHDMTGASTVVAATVLASLWRLPKHIITVIALTENMPSGKAIQPGNVVTARNGKTVEIVNTDAEGRLILADALDYIQDFNPDVVLNAATLTGAASIALGKICCGIMGNDEGLIERVQHASRQAGERLWPLPLYDQYFEDLKAEHADMRNVGNDSNGGTIRGGIFLKQFIRKGVSWAHLDIASTAWGISHLPYIPKKGASGLFVRTLAQFAENF